MEREAKVQSRIKTSNGFTLVEVMLSLIFLGLLATAVASVYSSGFQTLDYQVDRILLDGKLRSRMEVLVGTDFGSLSSGSEDVTINGKVYTINWTVVSADLDDDGTPEVSAKKVTVSVAGMPDRSLSTILVYHENRIGKIS
jgi:prepilin-type N-terminal cleavage/methylation domain-containing protein